MGIMQFHTHGAPRKYHPDAGRARDPLRSQHRASGRSSRTDARCPTDDPQPWWYGYSIGRWEGDTLVVETNGLRDDGWLDIIGTPLTDAAT